MPTSIAMNRVVHGAVRRDFERLVSALGEAPDGDRGRADGLHRAFGNLRMQLTHHHQGEDRWIWPMLEKVGADPHLLATMEAEHQAMSSALAETNAAMDAYAAEASASGAMAARESALRTRAVVEQHLRHEEEELEPVLVPHLDSPEWKAVEKKLSRQPASVAGPFFAWLTDGISAENRALLRSAAPAPLVFLLSRLFGRRYHRDIAPVWQPSTARLDP